MPAISKLTNYKIGDIVEWRPDNLRRDHRLSEKNAKRVPGSIGIIHSMIYDMPVVAWLGVFPDYTLDEIAAAIVEKTSIYESIMPAVVILPR